MRYPAHARRRHDLPERRDINNHGPARSDTSKLSQWTTTVLIVQESLFPKQANTPEPRHRYTTLNRGEKGWRADGRAFFSVRQAERRRRFVPFAATWIRLPGTLHNRPEVEAAHRGARRAENYLPNGRRHQLRRDGKSK